MKKLLLFFLMSVSAMAANVNLAWTASPSEDVIGYNVYMSVGPSSENFTLVGSTSDLMTTISDLTPGVYRFYVTSSTVWDESVPSNIVKTPAAGKPAPVVLVIVK